MPPGYNPDNIHAAILWTEDTFNPSTCVDDYSWKLLDKPKKKNKK